MIENMRDTIIVYFYCLILIMDVYVVYYCVKHLVLWIRKKICQKKEKVLSEQTQE